MTNATFILFAGDAGWRLGVRVAGEARLIEIPLAPKASPAQVAPGVGAALRAQGYAGESVLLALPSSWCFAASIETGDLPKHDRKAMLYRLEEKLPLAAEGMVADFVPRRDGQAVGVCARIELLRPLLDALEAVHVPVQSVAPAALLVAQHLAGRASESPVLLLSGGLDGGGESIDAIAIDEAGALAGWAVLPADPVDLELHLGLLSMSLPDTPKLESCGLDAAYVESIETKLSVIVHELDASPASAATEAAAEVLQGRLRPWAEFRRGALAIRDPLRLHRKPLNAALAAALLLLVGVAAVLLVRAQRYSAIEASAQRQMADAFREQFPGWEVPANVRVIVESEHRKAAATAQGVAANRPARSALRTFLEVLGRLPTEGRIVISKMTFDDSSFELEGQVRSYEQLDGIAAAARSAGMEVAAPESRKNAAGFWDFTLRGAAPSAGSAAEVAKGGG